MNLKNMAKRGAALTLAAVMLAGCGTKINSDAVAANINNGEATIKLGYANFVAHYNQVGYDMYYRGYFGDEYWSNDLAGDGKTMEETVKEQVMTDLERYYVSGVHAPDYNVEVTADDEKAITEAAKKFMDDNSDDAIRQMGATQEYVEQFLKDQTIAARVQQAVEKEADVTVDEKEAERSTIAYTYFATTEFDEQNIQVDKSAEDIAESKKHAENLSKADGDFEKDVEAEGGEYKTYTFDKNEDPKDEPYMDDGIIAAAQKLKEGERSDIIEVENDGFYVVYMLDEVDEEATATKKEELEAEKKTEAYNKLVEEWEKDVIWEINEEEWAKVKFIELFEMKEAEAEEGAGE